MIFKKALLTGILLAGMPFANAKIFEAEGFGDSSEIAKRDAISNAIKFSVGEFIVNKEELTNETFNQKIVSYSNAYIKKINILSQEKQGDGYLVKVSVDIESQKLIAALKEMQISVVNNAVDQDTLNEVLNHFDKVEQNKNTENDFENLVTELLFSPYEEKKELVELKILGKLKALTPSERDEKEGLFPLKLDIEVSPSEEYLDGFRRLLQEAKEEENSSRIHAYEFDLNKNKGIGYPGEEFKRIYNLSDKARIIRDRLLNKNVFSNYNVIKMELIDNTDVFKEIRFEANSYINSIEYTSTGEDLYKGGGIRGLQYVLLPSSDSASIRFSSGKAKLSLMFKLTKEEILNIKDLKLSFSN